MNKQTYSFHTMSGAIPGIPNPDSPNGEFSGVDVDVDMDTMTVLAARPHGAPPIESSVDPTVSDVSKPQSSTKKVKQVEG